MKLLKLMLKALLIFVLSYAVIMFSMIFSVIGETGRMVVASFATVGLVYYVLFRLMVNSLAKNTVSIAVSLSRAIEADKKTRG